ncbi:MAG: aminotransferase class V-fold PLP-dependent enzyme [Streptomycetaceae bacterium]|nr:MAG: aminotransferase class V-fold PLP-dependent enzyme [Streptomycetaceae bacterium]
MLSKESKMRDFPNLANRIYLNTAAEGIPPQSVLTALNQYGQDKLLGMDGRLLHEEQWRQVRAKFAQMIGLTVTDTGIASCSSEAYNLANLALRLKVNDEVIINDLDFPAGATPWMTDSSPANVKVWRSKDGELHTEDLIKLLSPKTRLVNTSLVSFHDGTRVDVNEISDAVRRHSGAMLAVDITQALGRIPLDLKKADLIISSTHKWLLGSHGGGLVGVSPERAEEWNVPAGGWFNIKNAFDSSRFESIKLKKGAESFMVGMPNYPAVYPVNAAFDYIMKIGVQEIDDHCKSLVSMCRSAIAELPVELLGAKNPKLQSGIIAFRHPNIEKIHAALYVENIHTMLHAGRMRISIHGYNDEADINRFLEVLASALASFPA